MKSIRAFRPVDVVAAERQRFDLLTQTAAFWRGRASLRLAEASQAEATGHLCEADIHYTLAAEYLRRAEAFPPLADTGFSLHPWSLIR